MSLNLAVTSRPAVRKPAGASAPAPAFAGFRNVARLPRCLNPAAACDSFMSVVRPTVVARAGVASAPKQITNASMNIVFVSAEVSPWSKTGGLGDVVGGLPIELAKRGHKVMSITPRYDQYKEAWDTSVVINIMGEDVRFFHCRKEGVDRVFVDHPWFLAKVWGKTGSKLYGSRAGSDFSDNQIRFRLFCEAAIEACRCLPFGPGEDVMFVANDWHSALVPVMLKEVYKPRGEFGQAKCAFCVHNIAFQGRFWPETFGELRLPENSMGYFDFEDGYPKVFDENNPGDEDKKAKEEEDLGKLYKKVNWMKAGFLTSDKNVTVSPNYAMEVSTDDSKGVELNKTILAAGGIEGIVNGMDVKEWSPMKDKFLDMNYSAETVMQGKAAAKAALQAEAGLPPKAEVPLFGFIGRLEEQKGIDILLGSLDKWLAKGDAQLIVLGTGKKKLEALVKSLETKYPNAAKGVVKFSAPMAHYITAGADFMMVPSRFEPCGLIQLHAMQYGTVPVVASTGGLVDTVEEGVTGFQIGAMDPDDLLEEDAEAVATTAQRAIACYGTPAYDAMVEHCINQDLSWSRPAKKWEALLEEVKMAKPGSGQKKSEVQTPVVQKKIQMASF